MISNSNNMTLYLKYDYLTTDNLFDILKPTKEIYSIIWHDIYSEEINEYYRKRIVPIEPQVIIDSIHTGDSVTLKLGEGYIPKVKFLNGGDVEVQLPKKVGIAAIVAYFSVSILTGFSNFSKSVMESKKAYYEKEKARIEYELKLKEYEKLDRKQKSYVDTIKQIKYIEIEKKIYELHYNVNKSENINSFKINNIEVYKRSKPSSGHWEIIDDE